MFDRAFLKNFPPQESETRRQSSRTTKYLIFGRSSDENEFNEQGLRREAGFGTNATVPSKKTLRAMKRGGRNDEQRKIQGRSYLVFNGQKETPCLYLNQRIPSLLLYATDQEGDVSERAFINVANNA